MYVVLRTAGDNTPYAVGHGCAMINLRKRRRMNEGIIRRSDHKQPGIRIGYTKRRRMKRNFDCGRTECHRTKRGRIGIDS